MDFIDVVKKRTATRKFTDEKIDTKILYQILEAGRLAPTAKNLQPQKIYVVSGEPGLSKVDKASPCRYNAPTVLLVCADKEIAWSNGSSSTCEMDASIVATHLVLAATNYGIDNIWIKHFDQETLKREFALPDRIEPVCLIPLGHKADDDTGNPNHGNRKPLSETVEFLR